MPLPMMGFEYVNGLPPIHKGPLRPSVGIMAQNSPQVLQKCSFVESSPKFQMYDEQKLTVFQQERNQSANSKNAKNTLRTSNLKLLPIRQHEEKIERGKVPMYQYFHPPSSFVLVFNLCFFQSNLYLLLCFLFYFIIYQNVLFIHTHNKVCNFVLFKLQCFGGHACQVLERMIKHVYL